jgi:hypothetical protein
MIEKNKGKDHERVKEKAFGQLVVKDRKGRRITSSMRGQHK